ncbi:hypothetical protein H6G97_51675, partial [Nostoc flagelliforme FACHB-838]|nr:hypothetical protein [Nostoc flagelliforme FACHB-838]
RSSRKDEELLKRRLDKIPFEEWKDLNLDLTPREYVMENRSAEESLMVGT